MKLLLIDGNNLAFRVHWTHRNLTYNKMSVSLLYGFFRSLISLKKQFPDHFFIIAWDGGYERRLKESEEAVSKGIIKSSYKANRREVKEIDPLIANMFEQMQPLREALQLVKVLQITVKGCEGDDIINTYVKNNKDDENLIVTSDKDFYQLLSDKTSIYDAMKSNLWTRKNFIDGYGFEPELWVDVGALMGDKGDNIIGVNGIGEVWATKLVKEFGNIDQIFIGLKNKTKLSAKEKLVLENTEVIYLAKSLKKMDYIENIPAIKMAPRNVNSITQWMKQFKFDSLLSEAWRLC